MGKLYYLHVDVVISEILVCFISPVRKKGRPQKIIPTIEMESRYEVCSWQNNLRVEKTKCAWFALCVLDKSNARDTSSCKAGVSLRILAKSTHPKKFNMFPIGCDGA